MLPKTRFYSSSLAAKLAFQRSPAVIDAEACRNGLAKVQTWVPLWGIAVGILTFGILVPTTTAYSCVRGF